jgi:methyl-accepting chemotaxis protein
MGSVLLLFALVIGFFFYILMTQNQGGRHISAQALETTGVGSSSGLREKLGSTGRQLENIVARNEAGNLALAFLRIQSHEQEYLKTGNAVDLRNLQEAIKNFSRLVVETKIEPVEAQVLRKGIKEYNDALDRYQAVSLATSDRGLSATPGKEQKRRADAVRGAAEKIASVINRVNVPDALPMVLGIRRHEADHLLTADPQSAKQVHDGLDILNEAFNSSSILQEHKDQVLAASSLYRDAFTSLVNQEPLNSRIGKSPATAIATTTLPLGAGGNNLAMIGAIAGIAVILIGFLVAVLLGRSISAPIVSMTNIVRRITSSSDFSIEIPVTGTHETGMLAEELNSLLRQQQAGFSQAKEATPDISEKMQRLTDIVPALQQQLEKAKEAGGNINGSASRQTELADQVNSSVAQLTAAADEMHRLFSQSDDRKSLIRDAVEHLGRSVEATVEGIKAVTGSSSQISEIITLSTEIAEQTSLLALNASVKAARAGSHGKEFAVIADEIAKLAQRSEELAREANQLTATLNTRVDEAIKLGETSRTSLDKIAEAGSPTQQTAEELAEQAAVIRTATGELGELAQSLADTVREMESMVQKQDSECAAALGSVSILLEGTSPQGDAPGDTDDNIDTGLKQAIENIAVSLNEQEEDEFRAGLSDEAAGEATATPNDDRA